MNEFEKELQSLSREDSTLGACISRWMNDLVPEDRAAWFSRLIEVWGMSDIMDYLAAKYWFRLEIHEALRFTDCFRSLPRRKAAGEKYTVAYYYRSIKNGGAQRVAAMLSNLWSELKDGNGAYLYDVVLIVDEPGAEEETFEEYPLNDRVKRAWLPAYQDSVKERYHQRYLRWQEIISRYHIDAVVSGLWYGAVALWDILSVKGHPLRPAFVMHTHSFNLIPFKSKSKNGAYLTHNFQLCDGVVTLSETDAAFASVFSSRVACISNPLTFDPAQTPESAKENDTLLWVGRLSQEKQPLSVIEAMRMVAEKRPGALLYVVGAGEDGVREQMENKIRQYGLENNVILTGFTMEIETYFQKASVLVSTSVVEGFPLTYAEAMAHGIPIVQYDLPWLTFSKDGRGICSVPQGRYDLMAKKIVELLDHPETGAALGRKGKEHVLELAAQDIGAEWSRFFESLGNDAAPAREEGDKEILIRYLCAYQEEGKQILRVENEKLKKELSKLKQQIKDRRA